MWNNLPTEFRFYYFSLLRLQDGGVVGNKPQQKHKFSQRLFLKTGVSKYCNIALMVVHAVHIHNQFRNLICMIYDPRCSLYIMLLCNHTMVSKKTTSLNY